MAPLPTCPPHFDRVLPSYLPEGVTFDRVLPSYLPEGVTFERVLPSYLPEGVTFERVLPSSLPEGVTFRVFYRHLCLQGSLLASFTVIFA